jgi:hypothetical protein
MTITLKLSSEQEHRLRAGAAQQDAQAVREVLLQAVDSTVESLLRTIATELPDAPPSGPPSRRPLAALRALSGTAHSDFTDISTDKYAHVAAAVLDSDG